MVCIWYICQHYGMITLLTMYYLLLLMYLELATIKNHDVLMKIIMIHIKIHTAAQVSLLQEQSCCMDT